MQNLIAALLLLMASIYLMLKWMPKTAKNKFRTQYLQRIPFFRATATQLFNQADTLASDGCGAGCGGCSSNNSCSTTDSQPLKFTKNPNITK
ncbi:hypothetical protein [Undibacterium sp. TJN19]|uniref:hypothetical protein n=1 Tax=Undibacterium sp. TJN19 TaxID=3413055 RepID=UPI003BF1C0AA